MTSWRKRPPMLRPSIVAVTLGVLTVGAGASAAAAGVVTNTTPAPASSPLVYGPFAVAAAPTGSVIAPTRTAAVFPVSMITTTAKPGTAAAKAIEFALAQRGLPYVWGGDGPQQGDAGFDCSGLTKAAYGYAGIDLPRTAHTQFYAGPHVPDNAPLEPGDLVFYGVPSRVHHVGLYIGGGRMVNAPTFGKPVQLAYVRYSGDDYIGATRPAAGKDAPGLLSTPQLPVTVPATPSPSTPAGPTEFLAPKAPDPDPGTVSGPVTAQQLKATADQPAPEKATVGTTPVVTLPPTTSTTGTPSIGTDTTPPDTTPPGTTPPETTPPDTNPPVVTPPVTNPPGTTPPITNPPVTNPPVTEPPVTEPPVTNPPATTPPVTEPPAAKPPVTTPPVTTPPVTTPPVTAPPVTTPPVTTPPVTTPPVTTPPPTTSVPVEPAAVTSTAPTGLVLPSGTLTLRPAAQDANGLPVAPTAPTIGALNFRRGAGTASIAEISVAPATEVRDLAVGTVIVATGPGGARTELTVRSVRTMTAASARAAARTFGSGARMVLVQTDPATGEVLVIVAD